VAGVLAIEPGAFLETYRASIGVFATINGMGG